MILKPITYENMEDLADTSYADISTQEKKDMIQSSVNKVHEGAYFEILTVYCEQTVVGFMNLNMLKKKVTAW